MRNQFYFILKRGVEVFTLVTVTSLTFLTFFRTSPENTLLLYFVLGLTAALFVKKIPFDLIILLLTFYTIFRLDQPVPPIPSDYFLKVFFPPVIAASVSFYLKRKPQADFSGFSFGFVSDKEKITVSRSFLNNKVFKTKDILAFILLAVIVINFINLTYTLSKDIQRVSETEPYEELYAFDGFIFLRTFFLIEKGENYYASFAKAHEEDKRMTEKPGEAINYRPPTLFYIWKFFLNNGRSIVIAFILFSAGIFILIFFALTKVVPAEYAFLGPLFLAPYFAFPVSSFWFVFTEYWGVLFLIISLFFLFREQFWPGLFFALLAALTRELFLYYLALGFLSSLIKRKFSITLGWSFAILAFFLFFYLHFKAVAPYLPSSPNSSIVAGISSRFNFFNLSQLIKLITFGMNLYNRPPLYLAEIFIFLFVLGAIFTNRNKLRSLLIPLSLFFLILSALGDPSGNDYWGVIYMPVAIGLSPLGIWAISQRFYEQEEQAPTPTN